MTGDTLPPKKRGPRKKSGFYHARWTAGLNEQRAAELLRVSLEQIQEWDRDGNELAERFLLLWDHKHVNMEGWEGFCFTKGKLKYKNKYWTPHSLIHEHEERTRRYSTEYSIIDLKTPFRGRETV